MAPEDHITPDDIDRELQASDGLMLMVVGIALVGGLFMLGVSALLGAF